uniref:Uncharacterized protein n=1 Tax=Streptomyces sp. NBC_00003 TaxID=2903608 RepID=A0AAU2V0W3_9ACTN
MRRRARAATVTAGLTLVTATSTGTALAEGAAVVADPPPSRKPVPSDTAYRRPPL